MKTNYPLLLLFLLLLPDRNPSRAQAPSGAAAGKGDALLLEVENKVEALRTGTTQWNPAPTNLVLRVKDRMRTSFKSRATIRLSNQGILRVSPLTTLEIQPPTDPTKEQSVLDLRNGAAYFFNRDQPVETQFRTPQASGAIRGTEFNIEVAENGTTVVTMLDGEVDLSNDQGQSVNLKSNEQGTVEPGQPPRKTAVLDTINIIQWGLYYPAILDPNEIGVTAANLPVISDSLKAYEQGDLLQALALYPTNRTPASAAESIYSSALSLAVGQVKDAETFLTNAPPQDARVRAAANALRKMIASVKFQIWSATNTPVTATEWMAESYYQQSRSKLEEALRAARQATETAPAFGYAWARVAELEFSFGRVEASLKALEKGLQRSPRNAQALALKGFLTAAQNHIDAAIAYFDQAIAIDGALGNAWLGRGLCRIRLGDSAAGRQDLQTAATLEPHRAVLRSYLGKAYNNEGDFTRAGKEYDVAQRYDPNDPTAWLYSALLRQQQNRINEGVRDLEKSQALNNNRRVFRSQMLLDQDRAVRSANLARIYQDAGMTDLSVREASRAVNYDYANFASHLFLANSYDALRDPRQITLRYESAWLGEYLLANLLAPVGASTLSQNISQQEYAKLFERDRVGISSSTEYLSRGDWLQTGSQFGTFGSSSYSLDLNYRSENGQRSNADLEALTWWGNFKQQITPQDTLFFQTVFYNFESGDVAQYYRQNEASLTQRVKERQEPNVFAGYRHEWAPGSQTLFLAGRLDDTLLLKNPESAVLIVNRDAAGTITGPPGARASSLDFRSEFEGYSTELQQIWQQPKNTVVAGGRYQAAWQNTDATVGGLLSGPIVQRGIDTDMERVSLYAYDQWQILEPLRLTAGVSYDRIDFPENIDIAPITDSQTRKEKVSPKVGLLWSPTRTTNLRGFYSQSLGGLFFDNSVRIEPVQVAGFTQTYRSLIPESVSGPVAGSEFEVAGVAADQRFDTGTYIGVEADYLTSSAEKGFGLLSTTGFPPVPAPSMTTEKIDYRERSVLVTLNQLVGRDWSVGARYKLSQAHIKFGFPEIPVGAPGGLNLNQSPTSSLNRLDLYATYSIPCGFFSTFDSVWFSQNNKDFPDALPGDDFWQFNFFVGYRFPRRIAEIRLGILNIADQDYQLHPLNLHPELPRDRTLTARLRFSY